MRMNAVTLVLIGVLAWTTAAQADNRFDKKTSTVQITGTIWDRDAGRLQNQFGETAPKIVPKFSLNSEGGDIFAAIRIGRLIRKLKARTVVAPRAKCHSACALIFIAGMERTNSGEIGLHRPYHDTDAEQLKQYLPALYAQVKDYVLEMGLSEAFFQKMMDTDSSKMAIYGPSETPALIPITAAPQ